MRKEIAVTSLLLLAVVAASVFYFLNYTEGSSQKSYLNALPAETMLVMPFNSSDSSSLDKVENTFLNSILTDTVFSALKNEFNSLIFKDSSRAVLKGIAALSRISHNTLGFLFILNEESVESFQNIGFETNSLEQEVITEITISSNNFYLFKLDNRIVISGSRLLIEGSLNAYGSKNESIIAKKYNPNEHDIVVNYSLLSWLVPNTIDNKAVEVAEGIRNWVGYGFYKSSISKKGINLFGGVWASSNSSVFKTTNFYSAPKEISLQQILPSNTNFFAIENSINVEGQLRAKMLDSLVKIDFKALSDIYGIDVFANLVEYIGDEYGYGAINNYEVGESSFLIARLRNADALDATLKSVDTSAFLNADSIEIRKDDEGFLFKHLFGSWGENYTSPYYAIVDGYLILSDNVESLNNVSRAYATSDVLSTTLQYGDMADWLGANCNFVFYFNPSLANTIPKEILNDGATEFFKRNLTQIRSVDYVVSQFVKTDDCFYNHVYAKNSEKEELHQNDLLLNKEFENKIESGPFLVTNYHTKKQEIMVVDNKGTVFQLDDKGQEVWSFVANGKMIGEPVEIDFFGNEKLQYLITTKSNIYLIDRKGNSVGDFPIKLPENAVGEPTQYAISNATVNDVLVPCKSARIYGYTQKGLPLPSWSPMQLSANPIGGVQYFVKSGVKYYFIADAKGNIYLWNKDGKESIAPISTGASFKSNFTLQFGSTLNDCKLLALDSLGNLVKASLNGEAGKQTISVNYKKPEGQWIQFDGKGGKELLLWDEGSFAVYDQGLNKQLEISVSNEIVKVEPKQVKEDLEIFAVFTVTDELFLYNYDGELLNAEPFKCTTSNIEFVDFDEDSNLDLVLTNNEYLEIHKSIFK